ncbi:hypothetical protein OSSY52_04880 [Tepiditoga spiralis]|uniref:4Fe-4S ferredoxin-type domain-containing protein n=1 Tax=Tepiditoga spiralis TaxID=2108365 RepID=A0A7G1G669_9BACT|nr:FAD-dependent oxidoreductase [Tepiditoga spiralis]BBE30347.1 hypothetical protein OSSY52_04880 [Tepiditoga spiralis]
MIDTDVLIIGGGPAGISAAISAGENNLDVTLIEEKDILGGQLVKQTHRFFGSKEEHAGTRGFDISNELNQKIRDLKNIKVMLEATAMGVYEDGIVTVLHEEHMKKINPKKIIMATGAFEKFLAFENNHLPGIFGAGAVQTLMNLYGILPGKKVLMIGSGNIGLIVSYQLAQAGVDVVGVIEASQNIGGYMVHASKLRRMGIPILTGHTIKKALGKNKVEGAIIYELDKNWNEVKNSEKKIECDVICISVGLSPMIDLFSQAGCKTKYIGELGGNIPLRNENMQTTNPNIYVAGDVDGIEEATAAMLEGEIAGLNAVFSITKNNALNKKIKEKKESLNSLRAGPTGEKIRKGLLKMNFDVKVEHQNNTKIEINILKKTGVASKEIINEKLPSEERLNKGPAAIFECFQKIPCNPCVHSCPYGAVIPFKDINDIPYVDYDKCVGCGICISSCPGLAIFVVNKNYTKNTSTISLPYEFLPKPEPNDTVDVLNRKGEKICKGKIIRVLDGKKQDHTTVITVEIPKEFHMEARNIKVAIS